MKTELKEIPINDVVVESNVREDYGDIDGLTQSIREHGVSTPLYVTENLVLIDGHRRLTAAKKAGLKTVPCLVSYAKNPQAVDIAQEQTIRGLLSKNLTPIEEAKAFALLRDTHNLTAQQIGKMVGRQEAYVTRRMFLTNCSTPVANALNENKINAGHAEILAQLTPQQQNVTLQEVLDYKMTVRGLAEIVRWNSKVNLDGFEFEKKEQKNLYESVGEEIRAGDFNEGLAADLAKNKAFKKEVAEYLASQRELLRSKGFQVYASVEEMAKDYPEAKQLSSYSEEYHKAVKTLGTKKTHAVLFTLDSDGDVIRQVWVCNPKEEKAEKAKKITPAQKKEADKALDKKQGESLQTDVAEWTKHWLSSELSRKTLTRHQVEALHLAFSFKGNKFSDSAEEVRAEHDLTICTWEDAEAVKTLLRLKQGDHKIEHYQELAAREFIQDAPLDTLRFLCDELGFSIKKEFKLTQEYLELHTKTQLGKLCKELGMEDSFEEHAKHAEIVNEMLEGWKAGKVPKLVLGTKGE